MTVPLVHNIREEEEVEVLVQNRYGLCLCMDRTRCLYHEGASRVRD